MAFVPIDINTIKVGDPITKEIMDLVKYNLDDLDSRVADLALVGGSVHIFNGDIDFVGFSTSDPDIFYYKATQTFSVNDLKVQLFSKQGVVSGNLVIDLQKSNDTNNANFTSILTSSLTFNFTSDADYSVKTAAINSGVNGFVNGQVLRIMVTGLPIGFYGKILLVVGAQ